MSSLRVRVQNKLLNKLGAAKPSKNVQFDMAHEGFEKAFGGVSSLDSALRGFVISMKAYHMSARVLVGAIESLGGNPENSPEMKTFTNELKAAFALADSKSLEENVKRFEQRVLRPSTGWVSQGDELKQQVVAFQDEKMLYDHYTRKVQSMREARDKRSSSGKAEKPKDVEKLLRNEQKLVTSTNSYMKSSDTTITNLRTFTNSREEKLMPLLHRLLEFRINYANQLQRDSQHMQAIIQLDVVHESILGRLELLVTHFVGVGPTNDGNPEFGGAQEQQPQAPEPSVQNLTFESFVGEEPPRVPPEFSSSSRHPSFQQNSASFGSQQQQQSFATAPSNEFFGNFDQQVFAQQFQTTPPPPPPMSPSASTPWDDIPPQSASIHPMSSLSPTQDASPWSTFDDAAKNMDHMQPPPPLMRQMPSFHKLHAEASLGII